MDILSQYKEQHPEAFREKPQWQPSSEYGFLIRVVMRLSGGRIRDARQAMRVLLIACVTMFAASIVISIYTFSGSDIPANSIPAGVDQRQFSNERQ